MAQELENALVRGFTQGLAEGWLVGPVWVALVLAGGLVVEQVEGLAVGLAVERVVELAVEQAMEPAEGRVVGQAVVVEQALVLASLLAKPDEEGLVGKYRAIHWVHK